MVDTAGQVLALAEGAWRRELGAGSSALTQCVGALRRCVERLQRAERVTVALVGDTSVGKSFLANLLLLASAPAADAYGARFLLSPPRLEELQDALGAGRPVPRALLDGTLLVLEGGTLLVLEGPGCEAGEGAAGDGGASA